MEAVYKTYNNNNNRSKTAVISVANFQHNLCKPVLEFQTILDSTAA